MSFIADEIASQPDCWRRAGELAADDGVLPADGERVAIAGCGTSWFIAQSIAALRESGGHGETDAFPASETPLDRAYDRLVVLTRSGTTTEVLQLVERLGSRVPTVAITADRESPIVDAVERPVVLDFADERSVVQTRFATTTLALFRAHLGDKLEPVAADAERALDESLPQDALAAEQLTFLGTDWTVGLALEAALKCREAAQCWTEAYPAMEYRHGPISISTKGRVTWVLGAVPDGLAEQVADTGATLIDYSADPMADLVRTQRLAVARAERDGLDPDRPRHLARSVILHR